MSSNIEQVDENSLIAFLRKNEYLFTILGVFLVLAFIFDSPQLISFVNPQTQPTNEAIQLQCSINGTDLSTNLHSINCTGNAVASAQSTGNSEFYSNSSRTFSFVCLLMALIVYLTICFNLYNALRDCLRKIGSYFTKPASKDDIIRDCMILFLIPFFYQGAEWFVLLLIKLFPDMMTNAVVFILLLVLLIQFISLAALTAEFERASQHRKRKIILLNVFFIVSGIWTMNVAFLQKNDLVYTSMMILFGVVFIAFGIRGILRYLRNRNITEFHDVI